MRTFLQNLNSPAEKKGFIANSNFHPKKITHPYSYPGTINHSLHKIQTYPPGSLQPELSINQPDDVYEKEADATADSVMNMPGSEYTAMNNSPASLHKSSKSMDNQTLSFMEGRFGFNFGNIAIHANEEAATRSRELNARAFTVGNNIYFNEGEYNPSSAKGKHLLAHELTHTIQQSNKGLSIQKDDKDKAVPTKPEIDFHLLPPDLKIRFWHLALEADTSQVKLDYETKGLKTGLSYKYGGPLALSLHSGITSGSVGFTPGDNQFQLGLSHGPFRAGVSATPGQDKYSLTLGFGDKLLPSPDSMGKNFAAGGTAGGNMLLGAPSALDDPAAYYKAHKDDIDNVSKSVDLLKDITDSGKKRLRFGADFSLSYDPEKHFVYTVRAGATYRF